MKALVTLPIFAAVTMLAACDTTPYANDPTNTANTAATFCVAHGGSYDIRDDAQGNKVGFCVFADGKEIDAWEYFRVNAT